MSAFFRLAQNIRPATNPLRTVRNPPTTQSKWSNYFHSSHSPYPNHVGLSRSRFYSNGSRYGSGNQVSNNLNVLYSLMGINVAVFGYGMYVKAQAQQGFPQAFTSFVHNWTCNLTDVTKRGAWYQLVTSTFSHLDFFHIAGNMFTAYYLGQFLCFSPIITPIRFLTIAMGAGVTGSLGFLYQRYLVTGENGIDHKRGLGFSGALMGITSVAACLAPTAKVYIYGLIPLPLWATVAGYAFFDGYYVNDNRSQVGHAGHLGGLAFGIAYYLLKLRGLKF